MKNKFQIFTFLKLLYPDGEYSQVDEDVERPPNVEFYEKYRDNFSKDI